MAQIVWSVAGSHPNGPKFYLLNASGPTMLRRAVRFAIEHKVDLILFSGSFEGGGNGDGRGPINRAVAEATAAGIPWINAAGNAGRKVYNGPVRILKDGYLRLRDGSDVAALRFRNRVDENTVSVTLTWNDYREEEDAGTDKDLDLYVEDPSGRRVEAGEKRQVSGSRVPGPDETRNPRERVVLTALPASPEVFTDPDYCYRIRIRAKRGRFLPTDRLRVLVTASREAYVPPGGDSPREALEFLDASGDGELYPPADNPLVLTVGDPESSSSIGRHRPPGQAGRHPGRLAGLLHRRRRLGRFLERRSLRRRRRRGPESRRTHPRPQPPAPDRPAGTGRSLLRPRRPAHPPGELAPARIPLLADPDPGQARRTGSERTVSGLEGQGVNQCLGPSHLTRRRVIFENSSRGWCLARNLS